MSDSGVTGLQLIVKAGNRHGDSWETPKAVTLFLENSNV